jgi:ribosomal protein L37AE/L43A
MVFCGHEQGGYTVIVPDDPVVDRGGKDGEMGTAWNYTCESCGYEANFVTDDFDCGFTGKVVTPISCPEHGVQTADTGMDYSRDIVSVRADAYPCPECNTMRPRWDRKTCPMCGASTMRQTDDIICWD